MTRSLTCGRGGAGGVGTRRNFSRGRRDAWARASAAKFCGAAARVLRCAGKLGGGAHRPRRGRRFPQAARLHGGERRRPRGGARRRDDAGARLLEAARNIAIAAKSTAK